MTMTVYLISLALTFLIAIILCEATW